MQDKEYKNNLYEGLSKLMKALSNPIRLEIIEMLSQGEKSVEGVVNATGVTFANVSQHLQVLKNNNIVKTRKQGHYVYYSIASNEFLTCYQHILKYGIREIAELEKTLNKQREEHKTSEALSLEELEEKLQNDNVLVIDVRPYIEYEFGHIPGAKSVPVNELLNNLDDLPRDKEIIAYCRGPFCALSDEAVKTLWEKGYNARRLHEGYPEWKMKQLESDQSIK
ncbi:MAG: metalloregulator ArsR/SmtB family transcription factor [Bacteroidales bacterium]|nr:metalloregulator ArsR/SmtB family transcription factor [Bacteroidales bacterium]